MKNALIIVAGGIGKRMGTTIPKQFLRIHDKPVIIHTIEKFLLFDPKIKLIIVINPDFKKVWDNIINQYSLPAGYEVISGGDKRFHSVKNGLSLIEENCLVGIHDAVRPLVSVESIFKIYSHAAVHGNAVPAITVKESVREINNSGSKIVDRTSLRLIQTPQVFRSDILKKAYEQEYKDEFTDDANVVEKTGIIIHLVPGDPYNIKITGKEDFDAVKKLI